MGGGVKSRNGRLRRISRGGYRIKGWGDGLNGESSGTEWTKMEGEMLILMTSLDGGVKETESV